MATDTTKLTPEEQKKKFRELIDQYTPSSDFTRLTDQELQDLQNAFTGYSDIYKTNPDTKSFQNKEKIAADIKANLASGLKTHYGVDISRLDQNKLNTAIDILADSFSKGGGDLQRAYQDAGEWLYTSGIASTVKKRDSMNENILTPTFNIVNSHFQSGKYGETQNIPIQDYSLQQGVVGNLLKTRQGIASDTAYLNDYLSGLPAQLQSNTSNFYNEQRKNAQDYLKQYIIPEKVAPIEANPLTTDREVADMIANLYAGVGSNINAAEANQAIQDAQFFGDAAYKTKMMDLINSRGNLQAQLASDYRTTLQTQSQNFVKSQTALQNEFDLNLFEKENQRALEQFQRKQKQQQDLADKQNEANMWSSVVSIPATIGTGVAINKMSGGGGGMFSGAS